MPGTLSVARKKPLAQKGPAEPDEKKSEEGEFLTLKVHRPFAQKIKELATLRQLSVAELMDSYDKVFTQDLMDALDERRRKLGGK